MQAKHKDTLRILAAFNVTKLWNAFKVVAGFYLSKWTGRELQFGLPISIAIEPTTACNLGCPECPSGLKQFTRPTGNLKIDFYQKALSELEKTLTYIIFYFQGEPYINPSFLDMVKLAHEKKIYTATSTNAHFLNPKNAERTVLSGLDRLIISIDGTTQEVYEQYRIHGKLDKVIEGTKNIVAAKRKLNSATPHIIFQFLVVKPNEHQIDDVYKMAEELGVDEVRLKTAQVYDYENGNPLIPTIEKYSRYKKLADGTYKIKNTLENHCWKLWNSCVITWDGKVVPCCFDKDATYQLGDLSESTFSQIWHNQKYRAFRASVLESRKQIDICTNCSEGTKVWAE